MQRKSLTENPALRETVLQHPAKGGSTPAFACQRAAIAPETLFRNCILFILKGNCDSFDSLLDSCFIFIVQFLFASQMWAARPHLASIFEKLLDQKTFICLRLVVGNTAFRKAIRIRFGKAGAHPQLA